MSKNKISYVRNKFGEVWVVVTRVQAWELLAPDLSWLSKLIYLTYNSLTIFERRRGIFCSAKLGHSDIECE